MRRRKSKAEGCEGIARGEDRLNILRGGLRRDYFWDFPASGNDNLIRSSREFRNTGVIE